MSLSESRWLATVTYRSRNGKVDVVHYLHELHELHEVVERGPHWDTIESITVLRINHCTSTTLTVEDAYNS